MKRLTLIAVILLFVVPQAFAGNTWHKTIAAAQKEAKAKNQLILVDMYAEWCGWCKRFEREVFPSEAFQKATDDMVLLRLDTEDKAEGTRLAQKFQVTSLPTFLLLEKDISLAGMIRGYSPPREFSRALGEARQKDAEFDRRVRDEAKLDYQKRLELAREFTTRMAYAQSEPRLQKIAADKNAPKDVRGQAYYELGLVQALQKKYDAALKTLGAGASQTTGPSLEKSRYLVGQIYMEQGNFAAAAKEFRNFKSVFPSSSISANVERALAAAEQRLGKRR